MAHWYDGLPMAAGNGVAELRAFAAEFDRSPDLVALCDAALAAAPSPARDEARQRCAALLDRLAELECFDPLCNCHWYTLVAEYEAGVVRS